MSVFKSTNQNKAKGKVKKIFEDIKKVEKLLKFLIFGNLLLIILTILKEPGTV